MATSRDNLYTVCEYTITRFIKVSLNANTYTFFIFCAVSPFCKMSVRSNNLALMGA